MEHMGMGQQIRTRLLLHAPGRFFKHPTDQTIGLDRFGYLRQGRFVFAFIGKGGQEDIAFSVSSQERVDSLLAVIGNRLRVEPMRA